MSSRLDRWGRLSGHDSPAEIGNMCYLEVVAAGIQMVPLIKSVNSSSMHRFENPNAVLAILLSAGVACELPGCLRKHSSCVCADTPLRRSLCCLGVYRCEGSVSVYHGVSVFWCAPAPTRCIDISIYQCERGHRCIGVSVRKTFSGPYSPTLCPSYPHYIPLEYP